ncbi:DNA-directed RNA polymerase II subunit RPB7 [Sesamum angolense]|uniref:DNA-directed RNA polymerase subunit n=1 Tax=Sesamum angolense TaxID=2727404 RepID=A0AAE1WNW5_9LAMI|nr:DNA-directed RNA polymerase II subunit RPB7 [Sesamum angolense]
MQLHPRHFGRDLRDKLVAKLMKDVEGTCSGRHGFIVAITGIESVGEILEAVVTMVNKMGFFAEAGPVQIFVSNHLIPDDMEFQSGDIPNYTTSDGSVKIQKDSEVRLKIIGTRVDATEIAQTSLAQLLSRAVLLSYSLFTLILVILSTASRSDNQLCSLIPIRQQILIIRLLSQFCIGTIKDDFLGVISDPGATS